MHSPQVAEVRRRAASRLRRAYRGTKRSVRGESNYFVHFFGAALVAIAAAVLGASLIEWVVLLVCITGVLVAELFHSAIERLATADDTTPTRGVSEALEIAQAGVMAAIGGSALSIIIVLAHRLSVLLSAYS
jgi:diacylglycerol kinase